MRFLPRLLAIGALIFVIVLLLGEVRKAHAAEVADHTRVLVLFGGILLLTLLAAGLTAMTFLPALGDKIGELIYGAGGSNENDPLVRGHEQVELGNYDQALICFQEALRADPDDTAAMSEIVDLQCRYREEPGEALALLEEALERHWPLDEEAFLHCKQAEIYGRYFGDLPRARQILGETMMAAPGTLYARNAQNLLTEFAEPEDPDAPS